MTTKLPGKTRFIIGVVVAGWALMAPASVPGALTGGLLGLGAFLVGDGLWAALEGK